MLLTKFQIEKKKKVHLQLTNNGQNVTSPMIKKIKLRFKNI